MLPLPRDFTIFIIAIFIKYMSRFYKFYVRVFIIFKTDFDPDFDSDSDFGLN